MDFTAAELYFIIPLGFVIGYGYHAIHKALQPVDYLYRKLRRRDNLFRRRRLSHVAELPNAMTAYDMLSSLLLRKLPIEIRQMIYRVYYEQSRFILTREGTLPSKHIAWMHDKDWRYLRKIQEYIESTFREASLAYP